MILNVAIVDDEPGVRKLIQADLRKYFPNVHVVGEAGSFADGKELLRSGRIDVVFMDVDLHDVDGDGIALVELFPASEFVVIFFTGHDRYVEDSYRLDAAYYIKKPYGLDQLRRAMEKAELRVKVFRKPSAFYRLATLRGYEFILWEEIVCLEADGETTQFHMREGGKKISTEALGEVARKLPTDDFCRVHRSHIVNRAHVRGYQREGYVVMTDGRNVPISSPNREEFLRWMQLSPE